jgi:hypothetical protein
MELGCDAPYFSLAPSHGHEVDNLVRILQRAVYNTLM